MKFNFVICIITQFNFIVNRKIKKFNCMQEVGTMKFGEKVKELRTQKSMSQPELAKLLGVSTRTIASYESCNSYPRRQEMYDKLAEIFEVSVDYLRTENDAFLTEAAEQYGRRGQMQAQEILDQTAQLFAGGFLSPEEELKFQLEMQKLFFHSKEAAKKFTPKKYLNAETTD